MAIALEHAHLTTRRARRYRARRWLAGGLTYAGLALALVFFLGPFFWIVTTSLKGNEDFFSFPPVWIPADPSLAHYWGLFTRSSGGRYFMNSLVISTLSMLAALAVSLPTGYAIARWRFGGGLLSVFLLVLRMLPAIALIIPLYIMYRAIGLTNSYLGLVIVEGFSYYWWRPRFFSYGGQYFDADMKPLINSPAGLRALEEMVRTMPYYPPGVLLFESEEPKTMLIKGEVPMLYSWTSTGKRVGNPAESVIIGKAGFGIVPGAEVDGKITHRPDLTGGRGMAVSIYSQKKEATMKVLEFISSPEQSLKIVMDPKTIMDPWRVSHFRSVQFRNAFPGADEYLDAIEKTFPLAVPDPVIPGANEYQRKLSFEITEALAKRKSPKEALDSAAAEWEKITDRRGRDKQKAMWGEKMGEMKLLGIEYRPDWATKAK